MTKTNGSQTETKASNHPAITWIVRTFCINHLPNRSLPLLPANGESTSRS